MKLIAITSPEFFPGEALRIARLLEGDFSLVHLRKPHADIGDCRTLLDRLPEWCWPRIVLHDHFDLIHHYPLGGLHLNGRNPVPPARYYGQLSCSCHSLDEVAARKQEMDYVLLSPIFDSISKKGYASAFSPSQLEEAASQGIIDHRVVALGGVTLDKLPLMESWHFGGAAMLGSIWQQPFAF